MFPHPRLILSPAIVMVATLISCSAPPAKDSYQSNLQATSYSKKICKAAINKVPRKGHSEFKGPLIAKTPGPFSLDLSGEDARFTGGIGRNLVRQVLKNNHDVLYKCHRDSWNAENNLLGLIILQWDLNSDGRVMEIRVTYSDLPGPTEACLMDKIKKIRFPNFPNDQVVRISYPFDFCIPADN